MSKLKTIPFEVPESIAKQSKLFEANKNYKQTYEKKLNLA